MSAARGVPCALSLALLLPCVALGGCYSFTALGRARTVEKGHVEVWAAPEGLVVATAGEASIRPVGEVGVRVGVTERLELDARLTTFGVTTGARVQLRRSPSLTSGVDVLIAPALAWTYPDKLALEVPLLVGINLPGEHQIVLAPRVVWQLRLDAPGAAGPVSFLYLGGSVGVALRLHRRLTLMPEVALLGEVYETPGYSSNLTGGVGLQFAIGVLFDQ